MLLTEIARLAHVQRGTIPTLRQYLRRKRVLDLYRSMLRLSYRCKQIETGAQIRETLRREFAAKKSVEAEDMIEIYLRMGLESLRDLQVSLANAHALKK